VTIFKFLKIVKILIQCLEDLENLQDLQDLQVFLWTGHPGQASEGGSDVYTRQGPASTPPRRSKQRAGMEGPSRKVKALHPPCEDFASKKLDFR